MKHFARSLALIAIAGSCPVFADGDNEAGAQVPAAVLSEFNTRYPSAENVEWESEDDGFEATFDMNGDEYEVEFDENGTWVESERAISVDALPEAVATAIREAFPDYTIEEVDEEQSSQHGLIYEVDIKKDTEDGGSVEEEVVVSTEGVILEDVGDE